MTDNNTRIMVLLSTYNGEKFLEEQLDSIDGQTRKADILVRDDGSTDSTVQILERYKQAGKLEWYRGANLRPAKSFWDLVRTAPDSDYYAFCDQDDVWFGDKIERALTMLEKEEAQDRPLLYCSNVVVTDAKLSPIAKVSRAERYTDFPHALIYSLAPGCTFVFNRAARMEMVKYDMSEETCMIHDSLAHKIVAMLGKVVYDPEPSMFYRQHGDNVIGAKHHFFARVKSLLFSSERIRSRVAHSLRNVYGDEVIGQTRHVLDMVADYRSDKKLKKEFKKDKRFFIPGIKSFVLRMLISFGKI